MINQNFKSILELISAFPDEETCIKHLEELRWNGYFVSPFDRTSTVYKCSNHKYRCKNTSKYFNVKTGTLFDNTKVKLQKWFMAIWLVTSHKKGISSLQLAKDIDVTQKTAWFMLQRIRACFGIENNNDLDNTVEADETYVGGKNKNRHVVGMVERNGKLNAKKINDVKSETLTTEIIRNVKLSASLYTDEWLGYKGVSRIYDHSIVKLNQGEYVNGRIHTNTIEGFWSLLKRGIIGIYHFTSKKHLQRYVDEFVFRYNTRNRSEANRFNLLLSNTEIRTTYKGLING
ncbi:IS1595 family transposase [Sulfurospirillum multivorans]|uniref:ISSpo3, transposase n=2 Tax=Sulfurospirillum multivorans TaxID=66821 RepID=A0AA86ANL2_SULMK|nr:IS1595 family transposase [Sulfurospirillum multivorans]AHJ13052.1 ISSpo3, transposase [Sulfurospirillum multivorans DSM 12446]QEH06543.1 transposase [Sulfurospirillum multivorans]